MSRSATFAILVIIILAASAVFALGNGMGKDTSEDPPSEPESPVEPGPTGMLVEGLPDGYSADVQTYTIIAPSETDWLVIDRLHTFYDTNRFGGFTERYEGDEVRSDSITLGVGSYTVVSGGCEFSVVVYGVIERTASWTYDMGGRTMDVSVTYTMDIQDLMESVESSREFNATHNGGKSAEFIHLPEIVVRDDLTDRLEDALDSEFRRVGGNPSDAQSYLDFIASFVQMNIQYPGTIREDGATRGWDYGVYGEDEYWAVPQETLYHMYGDCEDNSALLCALYMEAGFDVAMGGKSGHVFAGVSLDGFEEVSEERLDELGVGYLTLNSHEAVGSDDGKVYYAVETIRGQTPVGYTTWVDFGSNTLWGTTGFYSVSQGDESGIHSPS